MAKDTTANIASFSTTSEGNTLVSPALPSFGTSVSPGSSAPLLQFGTSFSSSSPSPQFGTSLASNSVPVLGASSPAAPSPINFGAPSQPSSLNSGLFSSAPSAGSIPSGASSSVALPGASSLAVGASGVGDTTIPSTSQAIGSIPGTCGSSQRAIVISMKCVDCRWLYLK